MTQNGSTKPQYSSRVTQRQKREQERAAVAARLQSIRTARRAKIAEVLRYGGNAFGSYAGTVYERTSA